MRASRRRFLAGALAGGLAGLSGTGTPGEAAAGGAAPGAGAAVSVRRFGARGDGRHLDGPAIERAIAAAEPGAVVEFPPGAYRIEREVAVRRSGVRLAFRPGARLVADIVAGNGLAFYGEAPRAWRVLAADAGRGATRLDLADGDGLDAGAWIELRSDAALPDVPNAKGKRRSELQRVVGRSGGAVQLAAPLLYDYRAADQARVGIAAMLEEVEIAGLWHEPAPGEIGDTMLRGLYLSYVAGVTVRDFTIRGSRPASGRDVRASSGVTLTNVRDVTLEDGRLLGIGWYGVALDNACRGVALRRLYGWRCRHAVSLSWSGTHGEPVEVLHEDCTSEEASLSGFDSHDVGRDVAYLRCLSRRSGDDGFQCRSGHTRYLACRALESRLDGFSVGPGAAATSHVDCEAVGNGRHGLNSLATDAQVLGGRYVGNGRTFADGAGILVHGGLVEEAVLAGNSAAVQFGDERGLPTGRLELRGLKAHVEDGERLRLRGGAETGAVTLEDEAEP